MSQDNLHSQSVEGLARMFKDSPDLLNALLDSMSSQSRLAIINPALKLAAKYFSTGKTIYDKELYSHPEFQKDILARPEFLDFVQKNPVKILDALASVYNNQWIFSKGSILDSDVRGSLGLAVTNENSIQAISAIAQNTIDMMNVTDNNTYYSYITNIIDNFIRIPGIGDTLKSYNERIGDCVYNTYSHYGSDIALTRQFGDVAPINTIHNITQLLNQNDFDKKLSPQQIQNAIQELLQPRYSVLKAVGLSTHTPGTIDLAHNIMTTYQAHMSEQSDKANILKGLTSTLFSDPQKIVDSKMLEGINTYFIRNDAKPIAMAVLDLLEKNPALSTYLKESTPSIKSLVRTAIEQTQGQGAYGMSNNQLTNVNNIVTAIIPALLDTPASLGAVVIPALNGKYDEMGLELFSLLSTNHTLRESLKSQKDDIKSLLTMTAYNPTVSDMFASYNLTSEDATKAMSILPILLDKHPKNLYTTLTKFREGDYLGMAHELLKIPENPEVTKYFQENNGIFAKAIISQLPIREDNIIILTDSFTKMLPDLIKEPKHLQDIISTFSTSPTNVVDLYDKLLAVAKSQPTLKDSISEFTEDLIYALPEIAQHGPVASKLKELSPTIDPQTLLTKPVLDLVLAMKKHLGEEEITNIVTAYNKGDYVKLATPILQALERPEVRMVVNEHRSAFEDIINHTVDTVAPGVSNRINAGKYSTMVLQNPTALLYMVNTYNAGAKVWNSIPTASSVRTAITPTFVSNALTRANNGFWGLLGYDTTQAPPVAPTNPEVIPEVIDQNVMKAVQEIAPGIDQADSKLITTQLMNALTACKDDEVEISDILTGDTITNLAALYKENKDSFAPQASAIIVSKYYQLLESQNQFFDTVEEQPAVVPISAVSIKDIETLLDTKPATAVKSAEPEEFFDALEEQPIIPAASAEQSESTVTATIAPEQQIEQPISAPPKPREWKDYAIIGAIINAWNKIKDTASNFFNKKEEKPQEYKDTEIKIPTTTTMNSSKEKPVQAPTTTRNWQARINNEHSEQKTKTRGGYMQP